MKPSQEDGRRQTIVITLVVAGGCLALLGAVLLLMIWLDPVG